MPKVAILYGTGEGPLLSRDIRHMLHEAGYELTADACEADIIIAHSGGALVVPPACKAKAILLAAPIIGHKGLVGSAAHKIRLDFKYYRRQHLLAAWLAKSSVNVFYMLTTIPYIRRMLHASREQRNQLPPLPVTRVAVVCYKDDPWSRHFGELLLHVDSHHTFLSLDRMHDDLWDNPKDYITVIQYLYES